MGRRRCANWLQSYMEYTRRTESPDIFHLWSGVATLACACGRSIQMDRGAYCLFPNFYIILVADSAMCRKSLAEKTAAKIITKAGISVFADLMTKEAIIQRAATLTKKTGRAEITMCSSELSASMPKQAAESGTLAFLTDVFDCPDTWDYETKTKGIEQLKNVCPNILAASTPRWLYKSVPPDAIGGGFTSRVIFVFSEDATKEEAFPELDRALEADLIADLAEIRQLQGDFALDAVARKVFGDWYSYVRKMPALDGMDGVMGRLHDHVLKLSVLLSVAGGSSMVVGAAELEMAMQMMKQIMDASRPSIFAPEVLQKQDKIRSQIRMFMRIEHSDLVRKNGNSLHAQEIRLCCEALEQSGEIIVEIGRHNKRTYVWKG